MFRIEHLFEVIVGAAVALFDGIVCSEIEKKVAGRVFVGAEWCGSIECTGCGGMKCAKASDALYWEMVILAHGSPSCPILQSSLGH
jgi:DNA-binding transcriptional regulator YdaS (Cro superfamily)